EPTPEHDDGLHNPNGVIQAVVTHTPEFANRVRNPVRGTSAYGVSRSGGAPAAP
ncbi:hypothetical protein J2Z77_005242, partial [Streptomyces avidinii]|nr:hypothetical protein [Streptomyces avidinii]